MTRNRYRYRHTIVVRDGEVDRQGVVFNSHYLAYIDDAMETWLRSVRSLRDELGWDMMLKRCEIEWHGSLASGDAIDIDIGVARWGGSSWDLAFRGSHAWFP